MNKDKMSTWSHKFIADYEHSILSLYSNKKYRQREGDLIFN